MTEKMISETEAKLSVHEQVCVERYAGFPWTITWPE